MAVKVNPEIEEYIDNLEYDDKIKRCLKEILYLELERYNENYAQYSADYNRIIERYLER
ncbi:hypothetical protein [Methanobrevibacter sp.]|uniref:hypothetical protein n=1 Tax=Methanobrevibacter sp. TaxID=66852 RepID=UPI00386B03A1